MSADQMHPTLGNRPLWEAMTEHDQSTRIADHEDMGLLTCGTCGAGMTVTEIGAHDCTGLFTVADEASEGLLTPPSPVSDAAQIVKALQNLTVIHREIADRLEGIEKAAIRTASAIAMFTNHYES